MSADLNPRLEYFVDYLVNVTEPETELMLETPFPLDYFLPKTKRMFYRQVCYRGRTSCIKALVELKHLVGHQVRIPCKEIT